jgi:putative transposase
VKLGLIEPGKPNANAYIESSTGDSGLNASITGSLTLLEALVLIEAWREDYNSVRLHSSLRSITPAEFAAQHRFATHCSTAVCS